MACILKSIQNPAPKTSASDKSLPTPARSVKNDEPLGMPLTAGPYLVPVTRWIE